MTLSPSRTAYDQPTRLVDNPQPACLAVALVTAALMVATEPRLAIVWDEGYTLGREARLRLWFGALRDPPRFAADWQPPALELVQQIGAPPPRREQVDTRSKLLFDPRVLAWFWPFAREEPHGHPPLYALVGLIGDVLTPGRSALSRARLGPILVFSLTAGALFGFVARRWGSWPGAVAAGAWVFQPNLFGHGHYATYDALLSALWLGAILSFSRAVEDEPEPEPSPPRRSPRWRWVVVFGLLLGLAADTKLTGWFVALPFLVWIGIERNRRGALTLLAGVLIAGATLYLINPPWWTEPIAGLTRFFASNLNRAETIRIKTLFLGRVVSTPDGSLPWYNTLVWTVLVTPVGFLTLALIGLARALRRARSEPFGLLAVGHWAFLLILRALPHTPGHDGVRQFLPAFGVLALLAGLGAATVVERLGRIGKTLLAAALVEGAVSVALMLPVPLSYYSPIVGGPPGAARLGMEPTYYWDALTDEALDWLKTHTTPGQKVRFATYPTSLLYLRETGRLPVGFLPNDPGVWTWYVVQNRPGAFSRIDRALIEHGRPALVIRTWGVPILWVFPYQQVEALLGSARLRNSDGPRPPDKAGSTRAGLHSIGCGTNDDSGTLAGGLTRGLRGRVHVVSRGRGAIAGGRSRGRAGDRGRLTSRRRLLVAEASEQLLALHAGEQTAMLLGGRLASRSRGGLASRGRRANRGRRRAGLRSRSRTGDRGRRASRSRLLLETTGRGVNRHQDSEGAGQGESEQVPLHHSVSGGCVAKLQKLGRPMSLGNLYALLIK